MAAVSPLQRRASLAAAALVALVALLSLAFWATLDSRLPTDDDYREVNERLARDAREGDVLVFAPAWADRGRDFITALPTLPGHELNEDPFPGYRRIWLLAPRHLPRFSLAEARGELLARPDVQATATPGGIAVGALWLEPFELNRPRPLHLFADELRTATVTLGTAPCRWEGRRFQCPRADWNYVGAGWYEVEEKPFRCIWAHPVEDAPLRITFRGVQRAGVLRGRAAFVGRSAAGGGAPVRLELSRGKEAVGAVEFPNGTGLQPFELVLASASQVEPADTDSAGELTFTVTARHAGRRHFCFDAWLEP